jgi:thioredoxin reductase
MDTNWDCIVVGGGAAGLSAALVLGRARRRTLVVDMGEPSNRVAEGIGGLLGQDGRPPAEFYGAGAHELAAYPDVEVRSGEVVSGRRADAGFVLELADGSAERTGRVLLATGMDYRLPELDGVAERWGGSVFHCPFCHGWEMRDRPLGVLNRGPAGAHQALLLRAWSDDVTLLTDGPSELDAEDGARLEAASIAVDERTLAGLRGPDGALEAVAFADGEEMLCRGLLVRVEMHQRSGLAAQLGADAEEQSPVAVDRLAVDSTFATNVPGLYAAGDLAGRMPSVANAIASGSTAAAMIVQALTADVSFGSAGTSLATPHPR